MLTTDQKGAVAELAIAHAAAVLGVGVFRPLTDGERYDLIFDLRPRLIRVQCKTAVLKGSVLAVPFYSARRCRDGFVKKFYSASEIDAVAAYNVDLDRCFFIPFDETRRRAYLQLRLDPCRNNQRIGINWAEDFDFTARLGTLLGP
ncbi:MAG: group I intron-associated PD-(D/E)XK endonuclease [Gaiellaceae bacterium]